MSKVGNESKANMAGAMSELGGNKRQGPAGGSGSRVGNETRANMAAFNQGSSAGSSVVGITGLRHGVSDLHSQHPAKHDTDSAVHRANSAHIRHLPMGGMKPKARH